VIDIKESEDESHKNVHIAIWSDMGYFCCGFEFKGIVCMHITISSLK